MFNLFRCNFVFSLLLVVPSPASIAAQNTQAEQIAATNAQNHKNKVIKALQECSSFLTGATSSYFKFLEYLWTSDNTAMQLAATEVLTMPSKNMKSSSDKPSSLQTTPKSAIIEGLIEPANHLICNERAKKMRSQMLDFMNVYPDDAKLLSVVFDSHSSWKIKIRNDDFTVGCVKSYWNKGERDFALVKSSCNCQTAILLKAASEQQLSDWVKDIGLLGVETATAKESNSWLQSVIQEAAASCKR